MGGVPTRFGGQILKWRESTAIRIAISASVLQPNSNIKFDSDVMSAINRSFEAWQDAADVEFQWAVSDRTNVSPSGVSGDGVSLITIAPTAENALLFAPDPNEAARTRVFFNSRGNITEADIVLNPYQQFSTDGTFGTFDFESTLTHEIGHLLGLSHSSVMSSTMARSFPKNGLFGLADLGFRTLDETDISAVRELYGADDDDLCCASIGGKLVQPNGRGVRGAEVWAQDAVGQVLGSAETAADGSFTIAGLPTTDYQLFWQGTDGTGASLLGDLGRSRVENGDELVLEETRVFLRRPRLALNYIGINGQLSDSAVTLAAGQEQTIYIGGKDLDPSELNIESSSPFIKVDPLSFSLQDFGDGVSVVTFRVLAETGVTRGAYTLFVSRSDGARAALVGALSVE